MINPNKSYKSKQVATVIRIENTDSYPYVTIETAGATYGGLLKDCHSQWDRIRVGDVVGFSLRWSIMADRPIITQLVRKRT